MLFERRYKTQPNFRYFLFHHLSFRKTEGAYSCLPSKDNLNYSFIFIQRTVLLIVILFSTKCFLFVNMYIDLLKLKGGYFDFSHLPELKNTYITGINKKKEIISSIIKNHKITNNGFFLWCFL